MNKCSECEAEYNDDDLDEEELQEAMKLLDKLDMKKIFIKDLMKLQGKLQGILEADEEEDDYNG